MKRLALIGAVALSGCMEPEAPRGPSALDMLNRACMAGDTNACAQAAQVEAQWAQTRAMTPPLQLPYQGMAPPPPMRGHSGMVNCQSSAIGGFVNTTCF